MERSGLTPVARPTEWTTALTMLVVAVLAWQSNHDLAALVSVAGACLPVIVTAIVAAVERVRATNAKLPPAAPPNP